MLVDSLQVVNPILEHLTMLHAFLWHIFEIGLAMTVDPTDYSEVQRHTPVSCDNLGYCVSTSRISLYVQLWKPNVDPLVALVS